MLKPQDVSEQSISSSIEFMAKTDDYWSDADMVSVIRYLRRNKALQVPDEIKPLLGMAG